MLLQKPEGSNKVTIREEEEGINKHMVETIVGSENHVN
jgi:hypothetical protein